MKKLSFIFLMLSLCMSLHAQNTLAAKSPQEALFDRGQELLLNDKYSAALLVFSDFRSQFPGELRAIDAEYYVAFCHLVLNNPKGEVLIRNFVEKYPYHPKSIYASYDLGSYYFKNKNYDKAIAYFSKVNLTMLDDANKLECNFKLGYSYMNAKDFDKAGSVFQRIKATQNKYTYAANYYLGYVNFKNELYDIAEQNLKKATENDSYKPLVPQVLVNVYAKQKKYDTLIAYSERTLLAQENIKNIEEVYLATAEAYYEKKNYIKALEYFEKFSAAGGKLVPVAQFRYGFTLYKNERYSYAIDEFKKINEQNDSLGQYASYYLGLSWLKSGNKAFAFNAFNQARKMNTLPAISSQSAIEYAKLGLELQKYTEVIEAMKEYFKQFPESEETSTANGLISEAYLNTNEYAAAIKQIESVSNKNRTATMNKAYQLVTYYRGSELFNEEKYPEAIEMFEKSLLNEYDKEINVLCSFWLGEAYSTQRKYEEAIINYQKVLKNINRIGSEISAKNYYGIAYAYFNMQEYAKALPYFKNFLDESKQFFSKTSVCDGNLRLADCYLATKKYKEADNAYQKVIDFQCAELDYPLLQRGIALASAGKNEEAKTNFRKITETYPSSRYYYDALYNLGIVDMESARFEASIPAFSQIIDHWKSETYVPLALQKRAIAYYNLKRYDKSAEDYQALINAYPTHRLSSSAVLGLQEALSKSGKSDQMDTILQAYKAINPKDANLEKLEFEKAKDLYFSQKYEESISKFDAFLASYPGGANAPDARYFLADAYAKTNNISNALKTFKNVIEEHKSGYHNKAVQKLAELNLETKDYHAAVIHFNDLIGIAANQKEISNAWNGLMLAYYELKDYDSSSFFANTILKNGGATITYTNRALLYLAKNALADDNDKAEDYLINCIDAAQDQHGAEAMYLLATHYYEEKKYKLSVEFLFELNSRFVSYEKWIGKAFLLIADNYVALDEIYQAKATLASIIERANDKELVNQAKEKLATLENQ